MYTSPTFRDANIKSIIFNAIITTHLRFPHKEILRYNFDKNHNIQGSLESKVWASNRV